MKSEIINILKKYKFGTKNLPDAMEWHCAYYWNRALPKQQIKNVIKTKNILSENTKWSFRVVGRA